MKFKEILQKWVINNIGYKILAIVFAFVLWLVIVNITDPSVTLTINNIEVNIENENLVADGSHVYNISVGKTISVSVTGKRSIVSGLKASDFVASADFAELSMTNAVPISVEMTGDKARYSSQLTIKPRTTSMVLSIEKIETKSIEVEVDITGYASDNMVMDSMRVSPQTLEVSAPESILRSIDKAIASVSYSEIEDSSEIRVVPVIMSTTGEPIVVTGDIKVNYEDVLVQTSISYTKGITLAISASGTPADGYRLDGVDLSYNSLDVKGSLDAIRYLSRLTLPSELIDVTGATANVVRTINLNDYLPDGVVVYAADSSLTITARISEIPPETTTTSEDETTTEGEEETTSQEETTTEGEG